MSISVSVPKNMDNIKSKVAFNLTARQLVCFAAAACVAIPAYFGSRNAVGNQMASLILLAAAMPFMLVAFYEKNGLTAEKIFALWFKQKFIMPGIRRYESQDIYRRLDIYVKKRKEALELEEKNRKAKERKGEKGKKAAKGQKVAKTRQKAS